MSVPTRIVTPSPAISPAQWIHAFAYTPDSIPARNTSSSLDETMDNSENVEDDALPTRFQFQTVDDAFDPGIDGVSKGCLDTYSVPDPALTVPAKRKRRSRGTSSQYTGADARNPCSGLFNSPSRPPSRRFMRDAVEAVNQKPQFGRSRPAGTRSTEGAPTVPASSHYPSPPASHGRKITTRHDGASLVVHSTTEHTGPSQLKKPLKVSKYFTRTPTSAIHSKLDNTLVLTPPSSPKSIIPTYTESPEFQYPRPTVLLDKPAEVASDPFPVPPWQNSSGIFGDLMIVLKRLKPILIQESVRDDPWKVLIAVRLLNVTTGKAAIPVFCKIISCWPTPQDLIHASQDDLVRLLRPLGLYNKRAQWLKDVSRRILQDQQGSMSSGALWEVLLSEAGMVSGAPSLRYPGVGPYALDSLRIFCTRDKDAWMCVMPQDKELIRYLRWRWAVEKGKIWYPEGIGVIGDVDVPYLITLVDELAAHYDDAIGGEGYMYHFDNDLCDMLNDNTTE